MKAGRNAELAEAFTATSTDEPHHCRNEFEHVDKVALSTNRFYMIDSLNPPTTVSTIEELTRFAIRGSSQEVISFRRGTELGLREAAFVSFYGHCMLHMAQSRILRAAYLVKAMGKALNEDCFSSHIDVLDSRLASAYEDMAYYLQMSTLRTRAYSEELRKALGSHLGKDEGELMVEALQGVDSICDREFSLFKLQDSIFYSEFLARFVVPTIAACVELDEDDRLSEFNLGIISLFENLPPQTYFVSDIETLDGRRLGHCRIPIVKEQPPSIDDALIVSSEETENMDDPFDHLTWSRFVRKKYAQASQTCSAGLAYQLGVSQLWRKSLRYACPCHYRQAQLAECPRQLALYREIRNFFMNEPSKLLGICRAYASLLEYGLGRKLSPWHGKTNLSRKNDTATKLATNVTRPRWRKLEVNDASWMH